MAEIAAPTKGSKFAVPCVITGNSSHRALSRRKHGNHPGRGRGALRGNRAGQAQRSSRERRAGGSAGGPFENLLADLNALIGSGAKGVTAVGETRLPDLMTRPERDRDPAALYEMADFGAALTPEVAALHEGVREKVGGR